MVSCSTHEVPRTALLFRPDLNLLIISDCFTELLEYRQGKGITHEFVILVAMLLRRLENPFIPKRGPSLQRFGLGPNMSWARVNIQSVVNSFDPPLNKEADPEKTFSIVAPKECIALSSTQYRAGSPSMLVQRLSASLSHRKSTACLVCMTVVFVVAPVKEEFNVCKHKPIVPL